MLWYPSKPKYIPPASEAFRLLDNDEDWIAEAKMDGWRSLWSPAKGSEPVFAETRMGNVIEGDLGGLREIVEPWLHDGHTLDGELLHQGPFTDKPRLYLFDVFLDNGMPCKGTLEERQRLLDELLGLSRPYPDDGPPVWIMKHGCEGVVSVPARITANKAAYYRECIGLPQCEGLVLKRRDGKVEACLGATKRNSTWFKVKEQDS